MTKMSCEIHHLWRAAQESSCDTVFFYGLQHAPCHTLHFVEPGEDLGFCTPRQRPRCLVSPGRQLHQERCATKVHPDSSYNLEFLNLV